jgi:malonyl-CoA decarboxylase
MAEGAGPLARALRRLRPRAEPTTLTALSPQLDGPSALQLRSVIDDVVSGRGGEVAARRRAEHVAEMFLGLDRLGKERFFRLLDDHYGVNPGEIDVAAQAVVEAPNDERTQLEHRLRSALEPAREKLFRRFLGVDSGLAFLVRLRADLHQVSQGGQFAELDRELHRLLEQWFDIGLLQLEHITWQSPASLLEKLIDYEAVHEIASWEDLQNRLGPDRRCFAFQHPSLPDDLLIFVEVALTEGLADNIVDLIDPAVPDPDPGRANTAIFYSISNCQDGLAGVRLGDFLIKRVVAELQAELPNIRGFATLSPIPGFRPWLEELIAADALMLEELSGFSAGDPRSLAEMLNDALVDDAWYSRPDLVASLQPYLPRLCARYLCDARRGTRALDPVANFHLSNGARVERLQFLANPARVGQNRALGMMVNYRYLPEQIEENHDSYFRDGFVHRSTEIDALL